MSEQPKPWPESLTDHVQEVASLVRTDTGTNRLSFAIAKLQARIAVEVADGQDRAAKALANATRMLVFATVGLVVATVALVIVTILK